MNASEWTSKRLATLTRQDRQEIVKTLIEIRNADAAYIAEHYHKVADLCELVGLPPDPAVRYGVAAQENADASLVANLRIEFLASLELIPRRIDAHCRKEAAAMEDMRRQIEVDEIFAAEPVSVEELEQRAYALWGARVHRGETTDRDTGRYIASQILKLEWDAFRDARGIRTAPEDYWAKRARDWRHGHRPPPKSQN